MGTGVLAVDVGDEAAAHAVVGSAARAPSTRPSMMVAIGTPRGRVQRRVEEHLAVLEVAELHAVLERLVGDPGEVVAVDDGRVHQPEDLEELVDGLVVVDVVDVGGRAARCRACAPGRRRSPGAACPRRGSAAPPWAAGAGTRRSPPSTPLGRGRGAGRGLQPENASIMAPTSAPSGYSTGHVHPVAMYSATLARHSSGVPDAVMSCTTSSGTSFDAVTTSSCVAGHVSTATDLVEQRLGHPRRLHDVGLLTQVLRDEQAGRVERGVAVVVHRADDELGAVDVVERRARRRSRLRPAPRARCSLYAGDTR